MGTVAEFASRIRGYLLAAGHGLGRALRRTARDVAVTVEERPQLGPVELELPYPLPTREDPLAFALFYTSAMVAVVAVASAVATLVILGEVPTPLVAGIAVVALVMGLAGNVNIIAKALYDRSTHMLRPLVGVGVPLLDAVHYWFSPVVTLLLVVYVLLHPSNNYLMHAAAAVMLVWTVTGLLNKLPPESPWNGRALKRWSGLLHRRPFVYVAVIMFVGVSALADYIY